MRCGCRASRQTPVGRSRWRSRRSRTHHHVEQRERLGHLHSSHFARSESVDAKSDDGDATRVKLTLYRDATLPMISSMSTSMMVSDMVKTSFIDSTSRALSFFWRSKRSMFCQYPRSVRDGVDPVVSTHEGQCQHGDGVARLCRGDVGETLGRLSMRLRSHFVWNCAGTPLSARNFDRHTADATLLAY